MTREAILSFETGIGKKMKKCETTLSESGKGNTYRRSASRTECPVVVCCIVCKVRTVSQLCTFPQQLLRGGLMNCVKLG